MQILLRARWLNPAHLLLRQSKNILVPRLSPQTDRCSGAFYANAFFSAPEEKSWLNALLHPLIQQETQRQFQQATSPYLLWVVPLLVENSLYKKADRVLVVDVTPETQLRRTMQRDDVTREHVEQILAAQATREARLAVADDVIDNNGAPEAIASDVARLHALYLQCASQFVSQEKP
ncbi:dephospho-CoA kinase [Citrobacter freundii]|nr:dephospho-CoA kinase [Citrobacter freundii]